MKKDLKEAIDYLKGGNMFGELSNDALEEIEDLISKEIPMKPKGVVGYNYALYRCGRCNHVVCDRYRDFMLTRCGNSMCGQVVDWSE